MTWLMDTADATRPNWLNQFNRRTPPDRWKPPQPFSPSRLWVGDLSRDRPIPTGSYPSFDCQSIAASGHHVGLGCRSAYVRSVLEGPITACCARSTVA